MGIDYGDESYCAKQKCEFWKNKMCHDPKTFHDSKGNEVCRLHREATECTPEHH